MKRVGLALGCGGPVGYAWSVCALRRFAHETGWDPRAAEVIVGTSAGSILAALLGSGTSIDTLFEHQRQRPRRHGRAHLPPAPRGAPLSLRLARDAIVAGHPLLALTGLLPPGKLDAYRFVSALEHLPAGGWVAHERCWTVAVDIASGERVAFGRRDAPRATINEAVAASCAVPGWIRPVRIDGRDYLDGGAVSSVSVDLLAGEGLDEIVVVSPMTSARFAPPATLGQAAERVMRTLMTRRLELELARVRAAGIAVTRIEPTARDLALMGGNFMDARRVPAVVASWS